MANYPDVQSKMQQEIDSVVPRNELPRLANKSQLPYVEATMCEIMRSKTLSPLALFHETICDTIVASFHVPAKTTVSVKLEYDTFSNFLLGGSKGRIQFVLDRSVTSPKTKVFFVCVNIT